MEEFVAKLNYQELKTVQHLIGKRLVDNIVCDDDNIYLQSGYEKYNINLTRSNGTICKHPKIHVPKNHKATIEFFGCGDTIVEPTIIWDDENCKKIKVYQDEYDDIRVEW